MSDARGGQSASLSFAYVGRHRLLFLYLASARYHTQVVVGRPISYEQQKYVVIVIKSARVVAWVGG